MTQLVFLVSLPRSGSTWLQSVIADSSAVATSSEGWVMLPLIECVCKARGFTSYSQRIYRVALESLKLREPNLAHKLQMATAAFAGAFYKEMAGEAPIFLDKTPRYSLICEDLVEIFPSSKLVILFRDPVDAARSIARTFGRRWNTLFRYEIDFVAGIAAMCRLARSGNPNVLVLRYEEAVAESDKTARLLSEFLGVDLGSIDDLSRGRAKTGGLVGDPFAGKGTPQRALSWGEVREISGFLNRIADADLATMGYARGDLGRKLRSLPSRPSLRDPVARVVKLVYKLGMAYAIETLFNRFRDPKKRIAAANDHCFGLE